MTKKWRPRGTRGDPCTYCTKRHGDPCNQGDCHLAQVAHDADAPPVATLCSRCTECGRPIYSPSSAKPGLCINCRNGGYDYYG